MKKLQHDHRSLNPIGEKLIEELNLEFGKELRWIAKLTSNGTNELTGIVLLDDIGGVKVSKTTIVGRHVIIIENPEFNLTDYISVNGVLPDSIGEYLTLPDGNKIHIWASTSTIVLDTYNESNELADNILNNTYIKLVVYPEQKSVSIWTGGKINAPYVITELVDGNYISNLYIDTFYEMATNSNLYTAITVYNSTDDVTHSCSAISYPQHNCTRMILTLTEPLSNPNAILTCSYDDKTALLPYLNYLYEPSFTINVLENQFI